MEARFAGAGLSLATGLLAGMNAARVANGEEAHTLPVATMLGALCHYISKEDPEKAELVKLRYFVGMTIEESAKALNVSTPTVKRWWAYSRSWLYEEMKQE